MNLHNSILPVKRIHVLLLGIGALALIVGGILYMQRAQLSFVSLPTYFTYSDEELLPLQTLSSTQGITTDDIYAWDERSFNLISLRKIGSGEAAKFYAYLAVAQRDFAYLSYNMKGHWQGNVNVISKKVLCAFYKDDCNYIFLSGEQDEYSEALADLVMRKVTARVEEDTQHVRPYLSKEQQATWAGTGMSLKSSEVATWKLWTLTSAEQFRVPKPLIQGTPEMEAEIVYVKAALEDANQARKETVIFWSGGVGTKTVAGIWLELADRFMRQRHAKVDELLQVRAMLLTGIVDAIITSYESKYTYIVERPVMLDPSINTIMPTPNSPSYPATDAAVGEAASQILSTLLPDNARTWQNKAREQAQSRVWGGIHFRNDVNAGVELGAKVGEFTLHHFR